jgi:hypothetical protein
MKDRLLLKLVRDKLKKIVLLPNKLAFSVKLIMRLLALNVKLNTRRSSPSQRKNVSNVTPNIK